MRFSVTIAVGCLALAAAALQRPNSAHLQGRQAPGSPAFKCHEACGGVIKVSREDGYCDKTEFKEGLDSCLECAQGFDIWKHYRNSVSEAAKGCGLDATPAGGSATGTTMQTSASGSSGSSATPTAAATMDGSSESPTDTGSPSISPSEAPTDAAMLNSAHLPGVAAGLVIALFA